LKIIAEIICGSHLYGLDTPSSDVDKRGVFLNTEFDKILGLNRFDVLKQSSEDSIYFELVHYLRGLKKTNTQMLEILFADEDDFIIIADEFKEIRSHKYNLINSETFYKSLLGYIENEKRLANGERTGSLGSKRKNTIESFGFSPKNFSHVFRLSFCGQTFFETGVYPVNISKIDKQFRDLIFSIKTEPEKYNKDYLNMMCDKSLQKLSISFKNRKENFEFDVNLANEFCRKFYLPFLGKNTQSVY
jgi:predicted nucleotidyltransferase